MQKPRSVAEQQLKEAEEVAYLEIRRAEEVLKQRTLRSPIDGVVVERHLVPGEYQNVEAMPVLVDGGRNRIRPC